MKFVSITPLEDKLWLYIIYLDLNLHAYKYLLYFLRFRNHTRHESSKYFTIIVLVKGGQITQKITQLILFFVYQ